VPIYQFECLSCGSFDARRPMIEASAPMRCPTCDEPAERRFSTPGGRRLPLATSQAIDRSQRSAYEPATRSTSEMGAARRSPRPAHLHRHTAQRPWQIGH
jgi:putative FmdB family regulatory protein